MADHPGSLSGKPKLPTLLTENINLAFLNRLPKRYHGRRRPRTKSNARDQGVDDITSLYTSFNAWDGLRDLQKHDFKKSDIQYAVLLFLTLFSLYIAPSAPALKFFALMGSAWLLLMPATRQILLPSAAIWIWLLYFFCSR